MITYLISSHISYSLPLTMLLETLAPQTNNIVAVIGGSKVKKECNVKGIRYIYTDHTSYDYTGLIEVQPETGHIFCLQDTMLVEPGFTECVESKLKFDAVAVFGGQCNLCLYSTEYLKTQYDFIQSMRNCTKKQSIDYEGYLWKIAPNKSFYPGNCICDYTSHYLYSSVPRIKEYYDGIKVIKYKANFGQTHEGNYHLCP